MRDDLVAQALVGLEQAQNAVQDMPEQVAVPLAEVVRALEITLDYLRDVEKRNVETQHNLVVQQALLDDRLLRVEKNRLFTAWNQAAAMQRNALQRVKRIMARSPYYNRLRNCLALEQKSAKAAYTKWVAGEQSCLPSVDQAAFASTKWSRQPTISAVLKVCHGRHLRRTLQSIENQVYGNWQLCLAIDGHCKVEVLPIIHDLEKKFGPVRYVVGDWQDDASALNAAAELITGEYVAFLNETAELSPFAFYFVGEAVQAGAFDIIYSDEDTLDAHGCRTSPVFKPDWSPDLLTSCMYMGNLLLVRRAAFQRIRGLRSQFADAHLHDLVLRLTDLPARIHHLPRVLYHSLATERRAETSSLPLVSRGIARAIEDAIARREDTAAECVPDPSRRAFQVRRKRPCGETTAIICSRTATLMESCLSSLRATSGQAISRIIVIAHEESGPNNSLRRVIERAGATVVPFGGAFNFAAMNNMGARVAKTPNLIFLNDDVKATSPDWAEMLNEQISREDVGAAGALMWYPSHVLQHAGLVTGIGDGICHLGRHTHSSQLWPWLTVTRNVSAVTGACLAIRRDVFLRIGGFDVAFPVNYNDVDLCFRVRQRGFRVVCVPVPGLIHRECQSRHGLVLFRERYMFHRRWSEILSQPDPFYSPALALSEEITLNQNHNATSSFASMNFAPDGR